MTVLERLARRRGAGPGKILKNVGPDISRQLAGLASGTGPARQPVLDTPDGATGSFWFTEVSGYPIPNWAGPGPTKIKIHQFNFVLINLL